MKDTTRLIALAALATCTLGFAVGCAAPRQEALERRQDGFDARHDARMDRRELRSERADARYERW